MKNQRFGVAIIDKCQYTLNERNNKNVYLTSDLFRKRW